MLLVNPSQDEQWTISSFSPFCYSRALACCNLSDDGRGGMSWQLSIGSKSQILLPFARAALGGSNAILLHGVAAGLGTSPWADLVSWYAEPVHRTEEETFVHWLYSFFFKHFKLVKWKTFSPNL